MLSGAVCGLSLTSVGCGPTVSQAEFRQLSERVQTLQAQAGRYDTQMTDLQNQVFLITDQQSRERADADARRPPPHLQVVKLAPPTTKNATSAPSANDVIDIELTGDQEPGPLSVVKVPPPAAIPRHDAADADGLFRDALRAFREGRADEASKLFARFVERYPDHAHADKALYWMGESRFESGAFAEAIQNFKTLLLRYPRSGKVAEALFRMGVSYERVGSASEARQAFSDLVSNYPNSALSDLARVRLSNTSGGVK